MRACSASVAGVARVAGRVAVRRPIVAAAVHRVPTVWCNVVSSPAPHGLQLAARCISVSRDLASGAGGADAESAAMVHPDEAAAESTYCQRGTKLKQTPEQGELEEELAHVYGRQPTFHELSLFRVEGPPLARIEDHGYLYGITEEELEGCSEAVRRAVSTHTAAVRDARRFRLQQVVEKFKLAEFDTGSSRVQGACGKPCQAARDCWLSSLAVVAPSLPCSRGAHRAHQLHDLAPARAPA